MIQLRMIVCPDYTGAFPQDVDGLNRIAGLKGRLRYRKEIRHRNISMLVEGDSPVDCYVFDSPEISLICRADLLQQYSASTDNVNNSPAQHLAALYMRHGDGFAGALRGTFAVILYDHRSRALKAWTDHFGTERLVFTQTRDSLAIATDLRYLLSSSRSRPEIDFNAIREYLQYTCIPTPKTVYKDIYRLAPGHQLTYKRTFTTRPYWDMTFKEDRAARRSEEDWSAGVSDAVRSAVSSNLSCLDNTRLAGCFLSGGTDSSSIAGLVGQLTGDSPQTFSIGFDDPRYNEMQYARIAAKRFAADHHEYFVKPGDILTLAQTAATVYDEPFGNSSIVPTYYCARLAAENGVTHLLAGDGGDELFGGNSRYVDDRVFQRYGAIPGWIRRSLIEPSVSLGSAWFRAALFNKASSYVRRSNVSAPDRYYSYSLLSSVPSGELFSGDFMRALDGDHPLAPARHHFYSAPTQSDLNRWLYLDLKITITDNDIRKVTTMSQLAGVTPRYPLLDPTLAEFTGTIPASLKVRQNQLRYLFKKAMQDILPQEIINKSKHGFGLPYSVWLNEDKALRDFTFDVLGSARCRQRGYFRQDLLEWLWSQYETHRGYYGEILWVFLMLELWHVTQVDSSVEEPLSLIPASRI